MSRYVARIGSALALALAILPMLGGSAAATPSRTYVFGGRSYTFTQLSDSRGHTAVAARDPGLQALLGAIGAVMTWQPGQRYVLITTAQPTIVSFSVGSTSYDVGPASAQASFAPFRMGGRVYLPLRELLHSLYLAPVRDGPDLLLQPQLGQINVVADGNRTKIEAHAAIPLHAHLQERTPTQLDYRFNGVGSTLAPLRTIAAGGVKSIRVIPGGTPRAPWTRVVVTLQPGARYGPARSHDGALVLSIVAPAGAQLAQAGASSYPQARPAAPEPAAPLYATAAPYVPTGATPAPVLPARAQVTSLNASPAPDGSFTLRVAVTGAATYAWHRLRPPDNRFWIDLHNTQLATPPFDAPMQSVVTDVRVSQIDPTTVRIALSVAGPKSIEVVSTPAGLRIAVASIDEMPGLAMDGVGSIGGAPIVAQVPPVGAQTPGWQFGGASTYVATNPRLIVIDPGHGGSDRGAVHDGVAEATLTLKMAKRLRAVLLARGWEVKMTRTKDVDVYKPYDTAEQELQARDDIANQAGALLMVSIHCNSYYNPGPNGTTTYYAKPIDKPLAEDIQNVLGRTLGTKNDGIVKSHLYIPLHAHMPAVLVETAFLSNPHDFALLTDPAWREKLALGIADGIADYAGSPPPPASQNQSSQSSDHP
ncbi:MAG: N-acetylmuramoyl-L-alanine amidase [Vulcanimicrobiaceae bacterium]